MRLIDSDALIAQYDRTHEGEAGKARKLMEDAPTIDAIPIEWINEWQRNSQPYEELGDMLNAWEERKEE